jgi:hypothetical protein
MANLDTNTEGTYLILLKKLKKNPNHSNSIQKFSETDIKMLEFLIDNIFFMFGGRVFQ